MNEWMNEYRAMVKWQEELCFGIFKVMALICVTWLGAGQDEKTVEEEEESSIAV